MPPMACSSGMFSGAVNWSVIERWRPVRLICGGEVTRWLWEWLPAQGKPLATIGILADGQSTVMLTLVALVAFLVQVYSLGY